MTDRDYFAAAALTRGMGVLGREQIAKSCYEMADAMLRECERTNHDAAPEAIASPSESSVPLGNGGGCGGTDKPVTLPAMGTGDIPDSRTRLSEAEIDALEYVVEEGRIGCMEDYGILRSLLVRVRPEWEAKADSLEAIAKCDTDSPQPFIAAYAVYLNGEYDSSYGPDAIDEALEIAADCNGEVVPLYRTPQPHATPSEGSVQDDGTVGPAPAECSRSERGSARPSADSAGGAGPTNMADIVYEAAENLRAVRDTFDQWSRATASVLYRAARHIEILEDAP